MKVMVLERDVDGELKAKVVLLAYSGELVVVIIGSGVAFFPF